MNGPPGSKPITEALTIRNTSYSSYFKKIAPSPIISIVGILIAVIGRNYSAAIAIGSLVAGAPVLAMLYDYVKKQGQRVTEEVLNTPLKQVNPSPADTASPTSDES